MKKKLVFLILIILFFTIITVIIKNYEISRADEYTRVVEKMMKKEPDRFDIQQGVKVEKIISGTPSELIILVNLGKNKEAYVSIKNWLTKEHDTIEIYTINMRIQE